MSLFFLAFICMYNAFCMPVVAWIALLYHWEDRVPFWALTRQNNWAATSAFRQRDILTSVTQTSLCSLPLSLEIGQPLNRHGILKRLARVLIRLRVYPGWSKPLLVAHTIALEISCRGLIIINLVLFDNIWLFGYCKGGTSWMRN